MRVSVPLTALLVVAVLLGGCEGADEGDAGDAADARTEARFRADQAVAEDARLRASDLGDEWEANPATDRELPESQQAIAGCVGEDPDVLYPDDQPRALSPTFVSPDDRELSSQVDIAATVEVADVRFGHLTSPKAIDCIGAELQRYLEEGDAFEGQDVEIGEVQVRRLDVDGVGSESTGFRVSVPLAAEGNEVEVHLDYAVARVGRALVSVRASSLVDPFPTDVLGGLTDVVVDRIDEEAVT